jgi:hypothetical protein
VAQHVKGSPALKHIPVLLLTGAFEPIDPVKASEAGCDAVLAKPFEPQLVIARVKELLEKAANGHGAAAAAASPAMPSAGHDQAADPSPGSKVARLDSYFAQLDAAFSTLSDTPPQEPARLEAPDLSEPTAALPETTAPDASLSSGWSSPSSNGDGLWAGPETQPVPLSVPAETAAQPAAADRTTSTGPAPLPQLADAFAALLAAEAHDPVPSVLTWPTPPAAPAPAFSAAGNGAPTEDTIEEVTRRVLDRLSDRVIRETVAELVSGVAERLVQEEIERLKASIK